MNTPANITFCPLRRQDLLRKIRIICGFFLIFSVFGIASVTANAGGSFLVLTTADGNGANAWTNANDGDPQGSVAQMDVDDSLVKIRRGNAKTYLRFDLDALDLSVFGTGTLFEQGLRISAVTVKLEQATPLRAKPLELYGINLNRDWAGDGRLGIDWDPNAITHLNAPASGAGGSISTASDRSILIGAFSQSDDFRFHTYSESEGDAQTSLLDYLNGLSSVSTTTTLLRNFAIAEASSGANNTDNFFSKANQAVLDGNAFAPTLELTIIPETHTFALIAGLMALCGVLVLRRRKL
jgi:hypothetical protein